MILTEVAENPDTQVAGGQGRHILLAPDTFLNRQQFICSGQRLLILAKVAEDLDPQVTDRKD